ncbi:hypothetical protein ECD80_03500 [Acinetobacter baumannii]|uniref:hypothetical protein n=1 Tax=Acinetobacter baumannii TaxID=470 RepID=UPI0022781A60|nr:hypothetical protein [Acinetobacter baumannii]MCY3348148.1 hypothetical protein [Acinetobacter baumannii]
MQNNLANQSANYNLPEFLSGDVVVLTKECRTFKSNDLFEVKNKTLTRLWTIKSENHLILVSSKEIRTATVAELNAKRRLTSAEQALAEVS